MAIFLLIASLALFAYSFFSLVYPLSFTKWEKALYAFVLLTVSMKFFRSLHFGGDFCLPDFPMEQVLCMEIAFNSLLFLCFLLFLKDILYLAGKLLGRLGHGFTFSFATKGQAAVFCLVALAMGIWGAYEAVRVPDVYTVDLKVKNLPRSLDGFTLIQLSDLHVRDCTRSPWLQEVVKTVNTLGADAVCITGDLVDDFSPQAAQFLAPLSQLESRYGVFGVTGNHEYFYDLDQLLATYEKLGVTMLTNEAVTIAPNFSIVGLPDLSAGEYDAETPDLQKALRNTPEGVRILLAHQPNGGDYLKDGRLTLQLSGHNHGGQIFSIHWLIALLDKSFVSGLYPVNDSFLYISRGTGLWHGFFCRWGIPSEITKIVLHPAD